jgi:hypothetical protein
MLIMRSSYCLRVVRMVINMILLQMTVVTCFWQWSVMEMWKNP